jgi:hypothetical protein
MPRTIKHFILDNLYPLLLFLITLVISIINYEKGTFLIGFDSLHNEFNLFLNIKRNFFGVWQTHQGLGLLGGMSHLSDIPRMLVLLIISLIMPLNALRYIWTFSMLIVGPLGIYFLILTLINGEKDKIKKASAFMGGLFYLFNLSTVQLFYSNFDGFVTHYGFIPWLFLTAYIYIKGGSKKHIVWFLFLSIISANQAYTGTLFFAFALFLTIFIFAVFFQNKKTIPIKRIIGFILLWIGINSFWMLPVSYFIKTSSDVVPNASINLMSSEESYFMNRKYGRIGDVLTLKNFWFDLNDYDNTREDFVSLFEPWSSYLEGKRYILYSFSFLVFLGFISSLLNKEYRPWSFLFLLSVFFLMSGNGFLGGLFIFFQRNIPLFKEALRFPFTKFSVLASLIYSVLTAFFYEQFLGFGKRIFRKEIYLILVISISSIFLAYSYLPVFRGSLVNPRMRVSVPKEYFEMYEFFNSRPVDERIYLMPSNTFWAWEYYDWGYRGSGFVWYGLKQPVLARAFDVWNNTNEGSYWEMSNALYSRNSETLRYLLRKYKIKWLLYDGSRIYPQNVAITNYSNQTKEYLEELLNSGDVIKERYEFGFLTIYQVDNNSSLIEYTESALPRVLTSRGLSNYDSPYLDIGDYISNDPFGIDLAYPYSHLSSVRSIDLESDSIISPFYHEDRIEPFDGFNYRLPQKIVIKADSSTARIYKNSTSKDDGELIVERDVAIKSDDSIIFLDSHFTGSDILGKEQAGLVTPGESINKLYIYRTTERIPFELFVSSRPNLSTCSEVDLGTYSVEYRDKSLYVESSIDNPSVCVFTGLVVKPDDKYLQVLNLEFDSEDAVGRVCFLDKEKDRCVYSQNFFRPGLYSVPLLNFEEGKEYLIYFYGHPSSDVSMFLNSYGARFSNVHIEEKELIFEEDIKVPQGNLSDKKDIKGINLRDLENITYVYGEEELSRLFRSCKDDGGEMDFRSEGGGLTFPIPSEESLCLTILTDSMLPSLPFSGVVEIDYEVSEKGQNVYVVQDSMIAKIDKFSSDDSDGKLVFSVSEAVSLSINVELTSPGMEDNFLRIKSVKVTPCNVKGVSYSKVSKENIGINRLLYKPLEYKGTSYVYKIKDVEKGNVIFNQSYSKDWVLVCSNLKCDATHYEMNGWQNIWNVKEPSKSIYIFYLPQLLGFVGFLTTLSSFLYVFFVLKKRDNY